MAVLSRNSRPKIDKDVNSAATRTPSQPNIYPCTFGCFEFFLEKNSILHEPLTSCQYSDIFCSTKNPQSQMYKDVHFSTATDGSDSTQQRCFGFVRNSRPKIDKDVNSEATRMSLVPCRNEFFVLQKTRSHKCTRMYICDEGVAQ